MGILSSAFFSTKMKACVGGRAVSDRLGVYEMKDNEAALVLVKQCCLILSARSHPFFRLLASGPALCVADKDWIGPNYFVNPSPTSRDLAAFKNPRDKAEKLGRAPRTARRGRFTK